MYDEKIEALISAALADGVLTEKEKQVLFKRAQAEGIDLDEFEMVLDARLVELQKAEKAKAEASAPKSTKYGDVRKCPACGSMIPALAGSCPECGYEFSGLNANVSSQNLAEKIAEIAEKYDTIINSSAKKHPDDVWETKKNKIAAIAQTIKSFPIPTTKADLFEFITTMQANMLSEEICKLEGAAYMTKYNEALIKAKAMCGTDTIFVNLLSEKENVLAEYRKAHKKQKGVGLKPSIKALIGALIGFAVLFIFAGIMAATE